MNIGIITSAQFPPHEGIGHYVTNLGKYLTTKGHGVTIFTRNNWLKTSRLEFAGLNIYQLPYLHIPPAHVHFHAIFLRRFLQQPQFQFDVLDFQSPLVPAINLNVPSVAMFHTLMIPAVQRLELVGLMTLLIKAQGFMLSRSLEQALFNQVQVCYSVRPFEPSELISYQVKAQQIMAAGIGVHDTFLEPLQQRPVSKSPYIFYAGRLDYGKWQGLLDLVYSIKHVIKYRPDVRFLFAGEGHLKVTLEKVAIKEGVIKHIEFVGLVSDRLKMRQLYQEAAVYVQPAYYEGVPTSILEAMASETPIVYTDIPGARDLITPEEGRIVPVKQPQAIAQAILEILADEARRQQMGRACREKVFQHYTWDIVGQKIFNCYEQAINRWGQS